MQEPEISVAGNRASNGDGFGTGHGNGNGNGNTNEPQVAKPEAIAFADDPIFLESPSTAVQSAAVPPAAAALNPKTVQEKVVDEILDSDVGLPTWSEPCETTCG
jgi:beta-glucanase (GH16 family)